MNSEQKLYKSRQWLKRMYEDEEMTTVEIGKICRRDKSTIRYFLIKFGIERRPGRYSGPPAEFRVEANVSAAYQKAFGRFAQEQRQTKSEIIRNALLEYMLKKGFNPFREN